MSCLPSGVPGVDSECPSGDWFISGGCLLVPGNSGLSLRKFLRAMTPLPLLFCAFRCLSTFYPNCIFFLRRQVLSAFSLSSGTTEAISAFIEATPMKDTGSLPPLHILTFRAILHIAFLHVIPIPHSLLVSHCLRRLTLLTLLVCRHLKNVTVKLS